MPALFSQATFDFLSQLSANNHRDWFETHKQQYEDVVRAPALRFVEDMAPALQVISPHFVADARKVGGALMRVYRDTRFSKDKTPYKTNIGIQFRHEAGKDVHAPGFYVHVALDEVFAGVGIWHPPAEGLQQIRQAIVDRPDDWLAARDDAGFKALFDLYGESLKRPPKGFDKEHPFIEDLKRKDFLGLAPLSPAMVCADDFIETVESCFQAGEPLMRFLCRAVRVSF